MEINVRAHHVEITKALKEHAENKLGKLSKYFDHITSITIELDILDTSSEKDSQEVRVLIRVPQHSIHAAEQSKDMYASIDMIYDKCRVQLKRHKEKLRDNHRHIANREKLNFQRFENETSRGKNGAAKKVERLYVPKPMGPEDAVMVLEEDDLPFVVFRNMNSETINVVYPLASGDYGLIET